MWRKYTLRNWLLLEAMILILRPVCQKYYHIRPQIGFLFASEVTVVAALVCCYVPVVVSLIVIHISLLDD